MEVFVKLEAYDTLVDREQIMLTRQVGGRQMQQMLESGKVKASGISFRHSPKCLEGVVCEVRPKGWWVASCLRWQGACPRKREAG